MAKTKTVAKTPPTLAKNFDDRSKDVPRGSKRCPKCESIVKGYRTAVCPKCSTPFPITKKKAAKVKRTRQPATEPTTDRLGDKIAGIKTAVALIKKLGGIEKAEALVEMVEKL